MSPPDLTGDVLPNEIEMLTIPGFSQLLMWASYSPITYNVGSGYTATALLDLTTNVATPANVTNTKHDMFCPGARPWIAVSASGCCAKVTEVLWGMQTNAFGARWHG